MAGKFYITTAIDYVNSVPHLGHAYEKLSADTIARWHRLKGEEVLFLTGTDENAQKNVQAAQKAGKPVKQFVDEMAANFIRLCQAYNISHDDFIRTTEERHSQVAKSLFQKLHDSGDIYKGDYEGLYCYGCEAFYLEKDLKDGCCPMHGTKPELIKEEAYFFRLSKYQKQLLELYRKNRQMVLPESRRNEMLNRVKEGLRDICVSRQNVEWGVPVPFDNKHKIYVWFDALINYISALGWPKGERFRKFWPADMHMIGMDINWFHSVIWPAMLIAAGIEPPKTVFVHGFITSKGEKLSKTRGIVIEPFRLAEQYGVDQVRYFLLRAGPFGEEIDYTEDALVGRINGELVADLGNLLNRAVTLADRFKGEIKGTPELDSGLGLEKLSGHMEKLELNSGLDEIWRYLRLCNKYISDKEPWKMEGEELGNVLYNLLEALRCIAIIVSPFMPRTAERMNQQLGVKPGLLKDCKFGAWKGRISIGKHLFEKVELKKEEGKKVSFSVTKDAAELGVKVKAAVVRGVTVKKKHSGLEKLKKEAVEKAGLDAIGKSREVEGYRDIYKKVKAEVENPIAVLAGIVKKAGKLPTINTVVDSYNAVAIQRRLSMGSHDLDKVQGDVIFRVTEGTEDWIPLGQDKHAKVPKGEYACMDQAKVLCRMDIKQSDLTKITEKTKDVFLYVQGNLATTDKYLEDALKEACSNITRFCGGKAEFLKV
ncbi:Methionyl-tRNA synthetase [sediment metagenome]|uniref:methionine--tRNA ligase n=1 Tax=sediment metagenome TaxID=749907 RepID=D9PI47_9ZZZZ